ncbi:hypothetical protein EAH79_06185 [Sphingomonas koreensis]|nr:hypothetical protein EAH79_06185 [Sphingomonas koreensis]
MTGGSRLYELRAGAEGEANEPAAAADSEAIIESPPVDFEFPDEELETPTPSRWPVVLACLLVVVWLAGMIWLALPTLQAGLAPLALVQFVAALCVPPALIGIVWLLAQRTSTAEARRFGHTAQAMRAEAASLERTIAALSRHLDANREQLADQTTNLMAMGDAAAERLAAVRIGMADEVRAADAQAMRLTESAAAAQSSLGVLLSSLPRAHAETSEMAKTLESTGLTASEHAAALDAQLVALADRGRTADSVASGAAQKLAAHIARMEATSETAGARLEAVTGEMSEAVDGLLDRTASAVDEARKSITAQGEAMQAMLESNQAALERASKNSVEALAERIGQVETVIERLAGRLGDQHSSAESLLGGLDAGIVDAAAKLDALHAQGVDRTQHLAASISALGGSANAMTESLRTGDLVAKSVIATSEDLLTALDAAAREIDETLPEALARLDERIGASRATVAGAKPELLALVTAAESTHDAIEAIAQVIAGQRSTLDQLSGTMAETLDGGRAKAEALGRMMDETIGRTHDFAQEAAPKLVEALIRVRDTASAAADRARETLDSVIPAAARSLEVASAEAMKRATGNTIERQVAAIAEAAQAAVDAAARATDKLSRQMETINAVSAAVEQRIDDARTERENADHDTFARRASLLIEALNSGAIDITKAFAPDVSDSAWAAYLKGDRGVFTRRAVRLLDANDAREIARMYDEDDRFRDQVNRYIHDFEAMLRSILAQRDGSPLGVTLLSSDMGKLYVALAQAIERLRA